MNWIFSIYLRLNKSGNQTTKWCPRSQGIIMGSWPRHCSVCDLLPIRALPCLFLLLGLLRARGQPEEMEIHFEAPFHKRFVNLCVLTMKRVKLLIKTPMLTHRFIAWSEMKKKKNQKQMNPRFAGNKMESFHSLLEFQLLRFRKHSPARQW